MAEINAWAVRVKWQIKSYMADNLECLLQAPAAHIVTVVFKLAFIKDFETTLEVEVQILLGVGEENNLLAAALPYIILPVLNELVPKADTLHRGVYGQGTGIPDSGTGLLLIMTGLSGCGIHCQPVIDALPVAGFVNIQPAMQNVGQIGRLLVIRCVELCRSHNLPVHPYSELMHPAEIGFVFVRDDGQLHPVSFFLFREPVGEVLVIVKCTSGKLCRLTDFAAL